MKKGRAHLWVQAASKSGSWTALGVVCVLFSIACSTLPEHKHKKYAFPKEAAYVGDVKKPYETLGQVRARADFATLDPNREEDELCRNYYNKAVRDLVKQAKLQGADAVIDIKSVVFFEDGKHSLMKTPECSDDGSDGQVLVQGIAVKWKGDPALPGNDGVDERDFAAGGKKPLQKRKVAKPARVAPPADAADPIDADIENEAAQDFESHAAPAQERKSFSPTDTPVVR